MRCAAISISLCLLASGCKVGPHYYPPETIVPEVLAEARNEESFYVSDEDLVEWWKIFDDPFLNELLEESICGSFDYRLALEQVCQARAQYWVQFTQILPEFMSDAQATRFRSSHSFDNVIIPGSPTQSTLKSHQDFFQVGLDAIWEIDLFGKLRRSAQASYDIWEATAYEAQAVKITVLSQVASTYATICALQQKIYIQSEFIAMDEELLQLSKTRFDAGLTNAQEVESNIANLASDNAILTALNTSLSQSIYSLATLLGRIPEELLEDFLVNRPIPHAEGKVPTELPGDLLRRRPDIRNAERNLAAATEQIGVAVADLYPSVSLVGSSSSFAANPLQGANIGYSSDHLKRLFTPASLVWGYGALVTWPVFDFGRRVAAVDAQVSLEEQAYLTYQKTVVSALEEAEKALITYFNEQDRLAHLTRQLDANHNSYLFVEDLFQSGLADYSQVVQAKTIWLTSLNTLTDSQQAITVDLISIYKSLGGDW